MARTSSSTTKLRRVPGPKRGKRDDAMPIDRETTGTDERPATKARKGKPQPRRTLAPEQALDNIPITEVASVAPAQLVSKSAKVRPDTSFLPRDEWEASDDGSSASPDVTAFEDGQAKPIRKNKPYPIGEVFSRGWAFRIISISPQAIDVESKPYVDVHVEFDTISGTIAKTWFKVSVAPDDSLKDRTDLLDQIREDRASCIGGEVLYRLTDKKGALYNGKNSSNYPLLFGEYDPDQSDHAAPKPDFLQMPMADLSLFMQSAQAERFNTDPNNPLRKINGFSLSYANEYRGTIRVAGEVCEFLQPVTIRVTVNPKSGEFAVNILSNVWEEVIQVIKSSIASKHPKKTYRLKVTQSDWHIEFHDVDATEFDRNPNPILHNILNGSFNQSKFASDIWKEHHQLLLSEFQLRGDTVVSAARGQDFYGWVFDKEKRLAWLADDGVHTRDGFKSHDEVCLFPPTFREPELTQKRLADIRLDDIEVGISLFFEKYNPGSFIPQMALLGIVARVMFPLVKINDSSDLIPIVKLDNGTVRFVPELCGNTGLGKTSMVSLFGKAFGADSKKEMPEEGRKTLGKTALAAMYGLYSIVYRLANGPDKKKMSTSDVSQFREDFAELIAEKPPGEKMTRLSERERRGAATGAIPTGAIPIHTEVDHGPAMIALGKESTERRIETFIFEGEFNRPIGEMLRDGIEGDYVAALFFRFRKWIMDNDDNRKSIIEAAYQDAGEFCAPITDLGKNFGRNFENTRDMVSGLIVFNRFLKEVMPSSVLVNLTERAIPELSLNRLERAKFLFVEQADKTKDNIREFALNALRSAFSSGEFYAEHSDDLWENRLGPEFATRYQDRTDLGYQMSMERQKRVWRARGLRGARIVDNQLIHFEGKDFERGGAWHSYFVRAAKQNDIPAQNVKDIICSIPEVSELLGKMDKGYYRYRLSNNERVRGFKIRIATLFDGTGLSQEIIAPETAHVTASSQPPAIELDELGPTKPPKKRPPSRSAAAPKVVH